MQNAHDPLPDPRPHDNKLRIPLVRVVLERLSQTARVNIDADIQARLVQRLTGFKDSALSQLHARVERVTFHHSSYRVRFLQTALRNPAVGLQPLKATHGMMNEKNHARARLSYFLDEW